MRIELSRSDDDGIRVIIRDVNRYESFGIRGLDQIMLNMQSADEIKVIRDGAIKTVQHPAYAMRDQSWLRAIENALELN